MPPRAVVGVYRVTDVQGDGVSIPGMIIKGVPPDLNIRRGTEVDLYATPERDVPSMYAGNDQMSIVGFTFAISPHGVPISLTDLYRMMGVNYHPLREIPEAIVRRARSIV